MNDYVNKHFEFGKTNPTLMDKPFWKYMVCNPHITAFEARQKLKIKDKDYDKAIWCFARFGATQTYLPNGQLICIGGLHEDSYDPDFQIYNDVVVIEKPHPVKVDIYRTAIPNNYLQSHGMIRNLEDKMLSASNENDVKIYGYPAKVFPPMCSHCAAYVSTADKMEYIYIIGVPCQKPHIDTVQVFRLNLLDFSIEPVKTTGDAPISCMKCNFVAEVLEEGRKRYIHISKKAKFRSCEARHSGRWLNIETGVFE